MEQVKDDIFKRVLGQVDFGPAYTPDVQYMPPRDLEGGRMGSRVKVLSRPSVAAYDTGQLFGQVDT